jgi:pyroglutamyl-peptidase
MGYPEFGAVCDEEYLESVANHGRSPTWNEGAVGVSHQPEDAPARPRGVVTGFEPFGGRRRNRSWEAVSRLTLASGVETRQLPVDYAQLRVVLTALGERPPSALLLVGECPGRSLAVEQIALNIVDTDRPDNSRQKPSREALLPDAPLALKASWDARLVAARMVAAGIPARASFHAGTYACNAALYFALTVLGTHARVGFLHVPYRGWPRAPRLTQLVKAIEIAFDALVT